MKGDSLHTSRRPFTTAFQPWSGNFGALSMVWATAHTTQVRRTPSFIPHNV